MLTQIIQGYASLALACSLCSLPFIIWIQIDISEESVFSSDFLLFSKALPKANCCRSTSPKTNSPSRAAVHAHPEDPQMQVGMQFIEINGTCLATEYFIILFRKG